MKTTPSVYTVVVSNLGQVFKGLNRGKARLDFDHYVLDSKSAFGRAAGEEVTLFEDDEILKHYDPSVQPAQPSIYVEMKLGVPTTAADYVGMPKPITDKDRMNFLVKKIVEVREPQFYGSKFMFTSQKTDHDPDEPFPDTTLRAQIDEEIVKERGQP